MEYKKLQYEELISWIRLSRTTNIGEITFYSLLKVYGSASLALKELPNVMNNFKSTKTFVVPTIAEIEKELSNISKFGGRIIALCEPDYPELLRHIRDAPPTISAMGNISLMGNNKSIAVVGSRSATLNSIKFAENIACDLAAKGFNIISGLANGIDAAAHKVIFKSFPTIAVMATGINLCYPHKNKALYEKICSEGLCITELPYDCHSKAHFFPKRNRIISGMSQGILIVEANRKSGSLITAKMALEQNREIFSIPGFPADDRFSGNNYLIKEGASLVENAEDIVQHLNFNCLTRDRRDLSLFDVKAKNHIEKVDYTKISDIKKKILEKLSFDPINIDELMECIDENNSLFLIAIVELELEDVILRGISNTMSLKLS